MPYFPRATTRPSAARPKTDDKIFYQTYFQQIGIAEAELEKDIRSTIRATSHVWSGEAADHSADALTMVPRNGGWLSGKTASAALPGWVTETDIDFYVGEFQRSGFRGPLNWYRNIDRNWELMAPWAGAIITVPALYMIGEHDVLMKFRAMDGLLPNLAKYIPNLREKIILPGCGHWTQRERAQDVNAALLRFLKSLS